MPVRVVKVTLDQDVTSDGDATLTLGCPVSERDDLAKRTHDLKGALMRISTLIKMMEQGFDFSAPEAKAYVEQLRDAHKLLKDECQVLYNIYEGFQP